VAIAAACGLILAAPASRAAERTFRAGAFAADITPETFPISVNGSFRDTQATAAHDPLSARCLVLDDGRTKIAFVVCDSCAIPGEVADRARQAAAERSGIPVRNIVVSATHTHSAPTVVAVFQSEPDEAYRQRLVKQIAEAVARAVGQLEPARIGWGSVQAPEHVHNRRWLLKEGAVVKDPFGGVADRAQMNPGYGSSITLRPAGPVDPEVSFICVQARPAAGGNGHPIAVLANYSLHYVGGTGGRVVSADYYGQFAQRLAQLLEAASTDPPFVGIMSNGTSGDVNNVNFSLQSAPRRQPFEQIRLVSDAVARRVAEGIGALEYHDWVPLDVRETEIELDVRRPSPADVADAQRRLAQAGPGPYKETSEVYARETLFLAKSPPTVRARLSAIRVGDLGVATIPCETFAETGLAIKKHSALERTFTIELANGYLGYLPTALQHRLGGYETWRARSSFLAADSETRIREAVLALLNEVSVSR
jgi:hypothetical protein